MSRGTPPRAALALVLALLAAWTLLPPGPAAGQPTEAGGQATATTDAGRAPPGAEGGGAGPSRSADVLRPVPGADATTPPELSATGWVLYDPLDRVVLAGLDPTVGRPMASTTKILTVLLVLEALEGGRIAPTLTVSEEAAAVGRITGAASLGLEAGDVVDVREVLAALVLRSGNDAAVAVAEHVDGSEAAFVERMNRRAAEMGLFDTGFVNSSGLTDDPQHRAAPLDLALLAEVAMAHEDFAEWAGSPSLDLPTFGTLENRNELVGTFEGANGVKTGFTDLAGLCLVASAERDGRQLIAVVLGSEDSFADAAALLDHGFAAYRRPSPLAGAAPVATYRVGAAAVPVVPGGALVRTVSAAGELRVRSTLLAEVAPPFEAGAQLGTAELLLDGAAVAEVPLVAAAGADVPPAPAQRDPASTSKAVGGAVVDAVRAFARLAPLERPAA